MDAAFEIYSVPDEVRAMGSPGQVRSQAGDWKREAAGKKPWGLPVKPKNRGYWDRGDVEIDLVAVNEAAPHIRFGTCKRNADNLVESIGPLKVCAEKFLNVHRRFGDWKVELVGIAPEISRPIRDALQDKDVLPQDIRDLTKDL